MCACVRVHACSRLRENQAGARVDTVDSGSLGMGEGGRRRFLQQVPGSPHVCPPSPVVTESRVHHRARLCFLLSGQA